MIIFLPNASGLVCAKNLRKWAEKAFVSRTLVFHGLLDNGYTNIKIKINKNVSSK
jgi:hypothetical protein